MHLFDANRKAYTSKAKHVWNVRSNIALVAGNGNCPDIHTRIVENKQRNICETLMLQNNANKFILSIRNSTIIYHNYNTQRKKPGI